MSHALILTVVSPSGAVAIHSVPGFPTELHANRAAEKWLEAVRRLDVPLSRDCTIATVVEVGEWPSYALT